MGRVQESRLPVVARHPAGQPGRLQPDDHHPGTEGAVPQVPARARQRPRPAAEDDEARLRVPA